MPHPIQPPPNRRMDRFDQGMVATIAALLAAMVVVVARGDQVGLQVQEFGPVDLASSHAVLRMVFNEAVDPASIERQFVIQPDVPGTLSVDGQHVTFRPDPLLPLGQEYSVSIKAGLSGTSRRLLRNDVKWRFVVRPPHLLYLAPAAELGKNLFVVDPSALDRPRQLTRSAHGVLSYAVSSDGNQVVYSEIEKLGEQGYHVTRLMAVNVSTGYTRLVYGCNALCTDLTWQPYGNMIAFQRAELNLATGVGAGVPRVWLFDMSTNAARPLFQDNQRVSVMPRWSPDGLRLAVYSDNQDGIVIRDVSNARETAIAIDFFWDLGVFSPDGKHISYMQIGVVGADVTVLHVKFLDLTTQPYNIRDVVPDSEEVNDPEGVWTPDSKGLIIPRQLAVNENPRVSNIVRLDLRTKSSHLLVPDDGYTQRLLAISPVGDLLAFQRVTLDDVYSEHPQLWLYSLNMGDLKFVAQDATFPGWLP
jgi:Tol biopolymer transport system component